MIQLRGLRAISGDKIIDKMFPRNIVSPSLHDLFKDAKKLVEQIPESERYNVYYTRGHGDGGAQRVWYSQDAIPFDIDNLRVINGQIEADYEPDIEAILSVIFEVLKVDRQKCAIVMTGNGLQILIQPERPITETKYFSDFSAAYKDLANAIDAKLADANLPGTCDFSVFSPNGLFRMPETWNKKPNKKDRFAYLINENLEPQKFSLCPPAKGVEHSEPWSVKKGEALSQAASERMGLDEAAIEGGCEFLKAAKAAPGDLTEKQWYAMLGIVGRFSDPEKVHEYSKGHPGYSRAETDKKTNQALEASGPRKCSSIDEIWGGCQACAYKGKVVSPIQIKTKSHIATEKQGFHKLSAKGDTLIPVPSDLRLYFERENKYVVSPESGAVFVFSGTHYRRWTDTELRAYAEEHFFPAVTERIIQEFRFSVTRTSLLPQAFFSDTTRGLVNFQNGVYSIKDKELMEHSPSYGFLYVLPFAYQESDGCPTFDSFLKTFTSGEDDLVESIKEFIGYAICDEDYRFQKCLVLLGKGSNGKSTFLKIIDALIGEQNISTLSLGDLSSVTAKSGLEGKLLNICDELPTKNLEETADFKNLFGGKTQSRKLFKDAQTLRNKAKFIFSGQEMPATKDTSHGFLRRLIFVHANNKFELGKNADPDIDKKVMAELPGIFNSVMAAYERAKERGYLLEAASSKVEHEKYHNQIDLTRLWVKEHLNIADISSPHTSLADLYHGYKSYMAEINERPLSLPYFSRKLDNCIKDYAKRHCRMRVNGKQVWVIKGVTIGDPITEF